MKSVTFFFNTKLILFIIIILATLLRFFQLGTNPPSLTWDEAAWGYNAYSLGADGRDEFGRFLPYDYLESFGDFKPPLYAYLAILPVKIFGLNEFATRFPSAFFGVLSVLLTYFLVKEIFQKSDRRDLYALAAAGILAISPWHIMLSRAAFEANVATFFIIFGVWSYLKGMTGKQRYLYLSAVSFALSFYVFNTARIVTPVIVLILAIAFRQQLLMRRKHTLLAAFFGALLLFPIIPFLLSPQASLRFREVNIFSDISVIQRANQQIKNDQNALWSKVIHNRRFSYTIEYLRHYFDHFNPTFLFVKGDGNPKFSTQDVGSLYIWELPFLIIGTLLLFKKKEGFWWILPIWLLVSILPSATARETPHALRIASSMPTFQTLVAYGFISTYFFLKKKRKFFSIIFFIIVSLNLFYFLHEYYIHYPREFSREWQYGYKESISYVQKVQSNYDKILVTTELGRPYIYYLFYLRTAPSDFRKNARITRDSFGFVSVNGFGKFEFLSDVAKKSKNERTLYIAPFESRPENAKILKEFYLLNGDPALVAYTSD